jgi:hypothetical protein
MHSPYFAYIVLCYAVMWVGLCGVSIWVWRGYRHQVKHRASRG